MFNRVRASEAKYRTLFEDSPICLWEEDFSEISGYLEQLRAAGVGDFRKYFNDYPQAAVEAADRLKILRTQILNRMHDEGKNTLLVTSANPGEGKSLTALNLTPEASLNEVKQRYKELVKRYHPDVNGGDRSAEERLAQVIRAYNVLKKSNFG